MEGQQSVGGAELRLIPEFGGSGDVAEWLAKAELVCELRSIANPETVIPLRLTGGAFAVYQQLTATDKKDFAKIKAALCTAFACDSFSAYEQFVSRKLQPGETVDVFLAELRKLSVLFGGVSDKVLSCAFVAGLPDAVRHMLRASARMDTLTIEQLLARARAIMVEETEVVAAVRGAESHTSRPAEPVWSGPVCFECNLPNHLAKDCLARRRPGDTSCGRRGRNGRNNRAQIRCFRCNEVGHIASSSSCPGKGTGERPSAPAYSPSSQ